MEQTTFWHAFPLLIKKLLPFSPVVVLHAVNIIHIAFALSALGGSYGILFSNHWNLYILAQQKHTFFSSTFTRLNAHNTPVYAIFAEAIICALYLFVSGGNQIILQQISVLGCTVAYTLSVLGSLYARKRGNTSSPSNKIMYAALGSCAILLAACIRNFFIHGFSALGVFCLLGGAGIAMFWYQAKSISHKAV